MTSVHAKGQVSCLRPRLLSRSPKESAFGSLSNPLRVRGKIRALYRHRRRIGVALVNFRGGPSVDSGGRAGDEGG